LFNRLFSFSLLPCIERGSGPKAKRAGHIDTAPGQSHVTQGFFAFFRGAAMSSSIPARAFFDVRAKALDVSRVALNLRQLDFS
jgi:hypothetical protein